MIILPANTLSTGGFEVANSCRFDDGDSPSMSKTPGASSNRRTFTFSAWVKRSTLGSGVNVIFSASNSANRDFIYFEGDALKVHKYNSGYEYKITTNRLFRDVSAWYHIVAAFDTTQGTASNRIKLYVNGVQETSLADSDYPSEDFDTNYNTVSLPQTIGKDHDASNYFDGYIAEVVMIDGSALAPTSFGEFNSDSPTIWQPIDVSGLTFGTNGYYLDFEDSSNLGNDANGGTDFTEANLAATDQATDTCTNNFAVMNSIDNYYGAKTFSEGNLQQVDPSGNSFSSHTTIGVSSGKWYAEAKLTVQGSDQTFIGVSSNQSTATDFHLGKGATSYGLYSSNGKIYNNSDSGTTYGDSYTVNDILGIYLDLDNNKLYFAKNGTIMNSGTGHSITAPASTELGFYFFSGMQWDNSQGCTWQFNFGSPIFSISSANADTNGYGSFEYDPSSGTFDGASKDF